MKTELSSAWVVTVIAIIVFSVGCYFNKPACGDGYVPMFVIFDGWNCVPGYKP